MLHSVTATFIYVKYTLPLITNFFERLRDSIFGTTSFNTESATNLPLPQATGHGPEIAQIVAACL